MQNGPYGRKQSVTVSKLIEEDPDVYETIYSAGYDYDLKGRMVGVKDTLDPDPGNHLTLASLEYDANGNRSDLTYYLTGSGAPYLQMEYLYTPDNWLRQNSLSAPDRCGAILPAAFLFLNIPCKSGSHNP